jgi:hypothetical protein
MWLMRTPESVENLPSPPYVTIKIEDDDEKSKQIELRKCIHEWHYFWSRNSNNHGGDILQTLVTISNRSNSQTIQSIRRETRPGVRVPKLHQWT